MEFEICYQLLITLSVGIKEPQHLRVQKSGSDSPSGGCPIECNFNWPSSQDKSLSESLPFEI